MRQRAAKAVQAQKNLGGGFLPREKAQKRDKHHLGEKVLWFQKLVAKKVGTSANMTVPWIKGGGGGAAIKCLAGRFQARALLLAVALVFQLPSCRPLSKRAQR